MVVRVSCFRCNGETSDIDHAICYPCAAQAVQEYYETGTVTGKAGHR